MKRLCDIIAKNLALIVLLGAAAAFFFPSVGHIFKTSCITPTLGLVMLGMGMTLDIKSLGKVFAHPKDVIAGFLCQFTIMPLLAVMLVKIFSLPPELAIGVILVGCCPGGTASNVITYLAKGDLALSVGMTTVSTLAAPVLTPLLIKIFAGALVPVSFWNMFLSILEVIIIPITLGLLAKEFLPKFTEKAVPYLPAFSTVAIAVIVISVVSANAQGLRDSGLLVIAVVVLHNICGYALGLGVARLLRMPRAKAVAISVEVGMQNSGLACSLATTHFASMAMAPIPGAVFSVWHNISGPIYAKLVNL